MSTVSAPHKRELRRWRRRSELFARKPRDGWTVWGNEVDTYDRNADVEGSFWVDVSRASPIGGGGSK